MELLPTFDYFHRMDLRLLFFILLTSVSPLLAQQAPSEPAALALLKKVSDKFESYHAVSGFYKLTIDNPDMDLNEEQKGKFYIKGEKFKLETEGQEIICNNESIWIHLIDEKEVQVNDYEPDENTITPTRIFKIYDKEFLSRMGRKRAEGGTTLQEVELTPRDKERPYFKVRVFIDVVKLNVVEAKIFDKNGSRFIYKIQNFGPNPDLKDTFFSFDPKKHPEVEVIDLR